MSSPLSAFLWSFLLLREWKPSVDEYKTAFVLSFSVISASGDVTRRWLIDEIRDGEEFSVKSSSSCVEDSASRVTGRDRVGICYVRR
ncbi:hypothetical protein F4808DRAFT_389797 [Astrocystis sublimbata]|nr:hypothetical protein F4808DRAFT_389797 [Astrocystis sublimbata]